MFFYFLKSEWTEIGAWSDFWQVHVIINISMTNFMIHIVLGLDYIWLPEKKQIPTAEC